MNRQAKTPTAQLPSKTFHSPGKSICGLCHAALYPIDTIKTRLQASISGGGLRALLKGGGGNALYAGVWGNLAGVMPASAIFMGVYEPVKQHISRKVPENRQYLGALGGGALAGFAASFIRVPTEVVKQRLQTGQSTHH